MGAECETPPRDEYGATIIIQLPAQNSIEIFFWATIYANGRVVTSVLDKDSHTHCYDRLQDNNSRN